MESDTHDADARSGTAADPRAGHRARLRARFAAAPEALSEPELLELLLTFAIPRRDVAPLAQALLARFGSVPAVLAAARDELADVEGVGETTELLLTLVRRLHGATGGGDTVLNDADSQQPALFELPPEPDAGAPEDAAESEIRTYANDEIVNALDVIPQAARFESLEAFRACLTETLPYNSVSTRQRRANYLLNRFFPAGRIDTPLAYYAARCTREELKPALFYHVLKAEPIAAKMAEAFVWPALPVGHVEREELRAFVLQYLPEIGTSSQKNMLRALLNTYALLDIGSVDDTTLYFQIHTGTLAGFLYILVSEFPEPGIYPLEALEQGPLHRWLLWDRAWLRRQLYNLRDLGIVAKISEIDTVRQFTLPGNARDALRAYFAANRDAHVLREPAGGGEA